jgi:hypothetical protein
MRPLIFKKSESTPSALTNTPMNGLGFNSNPHRDKSYNGDKGHDVILKSILEKRAKVRRGVALVQDLLKTSPSKLSVYLCCFLMTKVKERLGLLDKSVK